MTSAASKLLWGTHCLMHVILLTQCPVHRKQEKAVMASMSNGPKYFNVCSSLLYFAEVSAVFEAGTSVTYMFQEPYPVTKNISLSSSAIYTDSAPSKENIAFSFVTTQTPSLLLFINSSSQDFLAVLLCKNGECDGMMLSGVSA